MNLYILIIRGQEYAYCGSFWREIKKSWRIATGDALPVISSSDSKIRKWNISIKQTGVLDTFGKVADVVAMETLETYQGLGFIDEPFPKRRR